MIHKNEIHALSGLPLLQQLVYLLGIRPHLDYQTGIVGIKRGISYQSIAESLYVEPHQGIKGGGPTKNQLRRAVQGLERAGLLEIQSLERKLIFYCVLALRDESTQNKVNTKQTQGLNTALKPLSSNKIRTKNDEQQNLNTAETIKANTPQKDNYFIFLSQQFELFWLRYPMKKAKQKA